MSLTYEKKTYPLSLDNYRPFTQNTYTKIIAYTLAERIMPLASNDK